MQLHAVCKCNIVSAATILSIIVSFGCGTTAFGNPTVGSPQTDSLAVVRELPLPSIPATLRRPHERAEYLLMHFWDAMDFADTSASRNREFMEQNFANFASVFPHADTTAVAAAVGRLLNRAEADKQAYMMLAEIAEKYLYEPDSPLCSDDCYMLFLEELLRSPILGEYEKIRPAYQLDIARKNRTDSTAADFAYIDRNGRSRTLHGTNGKSILLVFYDPDCPHCMEIMASLGDNAAIRSAVSGGELTVLAVFADGDRESWKPLPSTIPGDWTEVLDTTGVQERELYSFKRLPTLYLLDEGKRVLLKDCDLKTLSQSLVQRLQNPPVGTIDNRVLQ